MEQIGIFELMVAAGGIILSTLAGVMAVKVDLAKLKTDVVWIKEAVRVNAARVGRLEKK